MGLGTLNVWVHDEGNPCRMSDEVWLVNVTYCSGLLVEWCGKTYGFIEAKCGHTEIELPPGCYIVYALQLLFVPGSKFPFFRSTHFGMVMVECDCTACVHLYTPTYRQVIRPVGDVARTLVEKQGVPPEKAEQLAKAANAVLENLAKTVQDAALEQLLEDASKKLGTKGQ